MRVLCTRECYKNLESSETINEKKSFLSLKTINEIYPVNYLAIILFYISPSIIDFLQRRKHHGIHSKRSINKKKQRRKKGGNKKMREKEKFDLLLATFRGSSSELYDSPFFLHNFLHNSG